MTNEQYERREVIENILGSTKDEDDCSLYEGYSGRGMYGKKVDGIQSRYSRETVLEDIREDTWMDEDEREDCVEFLENCRVDQLGLGYIFY